MFAVFCGSRGEDKNSIVKRSRGKKVSSWEKIAVVSGKRGLWVGSGDVNRDEV